MSYFYSGVKTGLALSKWIESKIGKSIFNSLVSIGNIGKSSNNFFNYVYIYIINDRIYLRMILFI